MGFISTSILEDPGRKHGNVISQEILNLKNVKVTKNILSEGKQFSGSLIGFDCVHSYFVLLDCSAYKPHINEYPCRKHLQMKNSVFIHPELMPYRVDSL